MALFIYKNKTKKIMEAKSASGFPVFFNPNETKVSNYRLFPMSAESGDWLELVEIKNFNVPFTDIYRLTFSSSPYRVLLYNSEEDKISFTPDKVLITSAPATKIPVPITKIEIMTISVENGNLSLKLNGDDNTAYAEGRDPLLLIPNQKFTLFTPEIDALIYLQFELDGSSSSAIVQLLVERNING